MPPSRRPTIADVARQAGVAKSAVSYALNDKPGVSAETRRHILEVAAALGWKPSAAARALTRSRVGRMGLVLDRPARLLGLEPFYMELISGLQEVLGPLGASLVLHVVGAPEDELAVYRDWAAKREVDAVAVADVCQGDPRLDLLPELGLPAVVLSPPAAPGPAAAATPEAGPQPPRAAGPDPVAMPWRWTDDRGGMRIALRYLVALGHRRIARVAGVERYLHTAARTEAMLAEAAALGVAAPRVVATDYGQAQGAAATRALLIGADRPTAILYDNDVMAAAGLQVAHELGLAVPGDVSLIAWDDSMITRLTAPPLTSLQIDVHAYGMDVAAALDAVADGRPVPSWPAGGVGLAVRATTGPPPD